MLDRKRKHEQKKEEPDSILTELLKQTIVETEVEIVEGDSTNENDSDIINVNIPFISDGNV